MLGRASQTPASMSPAAASSLLCPPHLRISPSLSATSSAPRRVRLPAPRRRAAAAKATIAVESSAMGGGAAAGGPARVLLEVRDLKAVVRESGKELLHGVDLTINEGEVHAIMGKNGSGKSTLSKAGHSIHIGGLIRLDVEELSIDTIYITVWASSLLPLHVGKIENASAMMENHFGLQLQPPISEKRVKELGKWVRKEFRITGKSWDANSADIAATGLGWFAIGLKGEAVLGVRTYDGVDVVSRSSLIHKRASIFKEAGFTVSKIVAKADSLSNKVKHNKPEKKEAGSMQIERSCFAVSKT